MITTLTGQHGNTFHAINRDGTAALCRASLKPRTWQSASGGFSSTENWVAAIYRLPGESFARSCSRERVNCLACQRKLAKITAEAFDAATAQDADFVAPAPAPVVEVSELVVYRTGSPVPYRYLGQDVTRGESFFWVANPAGGQQRLTKAELTTTWSARPEATLRERYAGTVTRFNPEVLEQVHAVALSENAKRNPPEYTTADTARVSQRVYLYDGQSDSTVAGNVVAVVGQSLDVIVVQAWVWTDGKARKRLFYPTRVRSGDQLRAALETPPPSPFPVGSHVAAHLSPDRPYLVESVEVGKHDGRTRVYLVHADGERLAFKPSVLAKMFAPVLAPFPNADHLIGERVTLTSADPRQSVGTISGTVASVRPAPAGSRHAVAVLESGYLVELPASLVELTSGPF